MKQKIKWDRREDDGTVHATGHVLLSGTFALQGRHAATLHGQSQVRWQDSKMPTVLHVRHVWDPGIFQNITGALTIEPGPAMLT